MWDGEEREEREGSKGGRNEGDGRDVMGWVNMR